MTHKIYGCILACFLSGSTFAVALTSEKENAANSGENTKVPPTENQPQPENPESPLPENPLEQDISSEPESPLETPQPELTATSDTPEKKPESPEPSPCIPISFKAKGWVSAANSNATDYPIVVDKETLILLPDDRYGAATAAIFSSLVSPPFEVQFEFNTYDNDGGYQGVMGNKQHRRIMNPSS